MKWPKLSFYSKQIKKTMQSRRYVENPRDRQFFEASGRHGDFFEKTRFRLGQWEYLCKISGLYRFPSGQET